MTPRKVRVRHIEVEGTDVQHWRDDDSDVIVIAFGADLDDVTRKRVEREILAEYGVERKRRAVPLLFGGMDTSWLSDRAPVAITAATAGAAATAIAFVFLPAVFGANESGHPPAAAGPTQQPPVAAPPSVPPKPHNTRAGTPPPRSPRAATSPAARGRSPLLMVTEPISGPALPGIKPGRLIPPTRPTPPVLPPPTEIPDPVPAPPDRCLLTVRINDTALRLLCWPARTGQAD